MLVGTMLVGGLGILVSRYLSNTALFVAMRCLVSRITILCYMICNFKRKTCVRQVVLDKWFPLSRPEKSWTNIARLWVRKAWIPEWLAHGDPQGVLRKGG